MFTGCDGITISTEIARVTFSTFAGTIDTLAWGTMNTGYCRAVGAIIAIGTLVAGRTGPVGITGTGGWVTGTIITGTMTITLVVSTAGTG